MGRLFLEALEGTKTFACRACRAVLAAEEQLLSKQFHSKNGPAWLFERVVNVVPGPGEERLMTTGVHVVADIACTRCHSVVGWKYEAAAEESQRYKVGKFILERSQVVDAAPLPPPPLLLPRLLERGPRDGAAHELEGGSSDDIDAVGCTSVAAREQRAAAPAPWAAMAAAGAGGAGAGGQDAPWYSLDTVCVHCGKDDFAPEYGPRNLILCSCCAAKGTHVDCFEASTGRVLTEEFINSGSSWFCSPACEEVSGYLESHSNVRQPLRGEAGEYTIEVVRYDPDSRGVRAVVDTALKIFRSSFDPLIMPNGQDLVAMCCTAYESPDGGEPGGGGAGSGQEGEEEEPEGYDYSGFRVVALRKSGQIVSVATLRATGARGTAAASSRRGAGGAARRASALRGSAAHHHARVSRPPSRCAVPPPPPPRGPQGVEDMLRALRVRWLVLPSIRAVLPMWRYNFSFMPLTLQEAAALEQHVVTPDFESAQLVKKRTWPRAGGAAAGGGRAGGGGARRPRARGAAPRAGAGAGARRSGSRSGSRARARGGKAGADEGEAGLALSFGGRRARGAAGDADADASDGEGSGDGAAGAAPDDPWAAEARAAWAAFEAAEGPMRAASSEDSSSEEDDGEDEESGGERAAGRRRGRARGRAGRRQRRGGGDGDDEWQGERAARPRGPTAPLCLRAHARRRPARRASAGGAQDGGSSSDSDGDALDLVSEDGHGIPAASRRRQAGPCPAASAPPSPAAPPGAAAAGAAEGSVAAAAALGAPPTAEEQAAALERLRRDVERAGGVLPDGWSIKLTVRLGPGAFKNKAFIEPGTGTAFRSVTGVKRQLGLLPAQRAKPPPAGPAVQPGAAVAGGAAGAQPAERRAPGAGAARACGAGSAQPSPATAAQAAALRELRDASKGAKLQRARLSRVRRRHVQEAAVGLALADAVKRFYVAAAAQLAPARAQEPAPLASSEASEAPPALPPCQAASALTALASQQAATIEAQAWQLEEQRAALDAQRAALDAQERRGQEQQQQIASLLAQLQVAATAAAAVPALRPQEPPGAAGAVRADEAAAHDADAEAADGCTTTLTDDTPMDWAPVPEPEGAAGTDHQQAGGAASPPAPLSELPAAVPAGCASPPAAVPAGCASPPAPRGPPAAVLAADGEAPTASPTPAAPAASEAALPSPATAGAAASSTQAAAPAPAELAEGAPGPDAGAALAPAVARAPGATAATPCQQARHAGVAPRLAPAGLSCSGGVLAKAPGAQSGSERLSDSFLAGLLPAVVGQLLETPGKHDQGCPAPASPGPQPGGGPAACQATARPNPARSCGAPPPPPATACSALAGPAPGPETAAAAASPERRGSQPGSQGGSQPRSAGAEEESGEGSCACDPRAASPVASPPPPPGPAAPPRCGTASRPGGGAELLCLFDHLVGDAREGGFEGAEPNHRRAGIEEIADAARARALRRRACLAGTTRGQHPPHARASAAGSARRGRPTMAPAAREPPAARAAVALVELAAVSGAAAEAAEAAEAEDAAAPGGGLAAALRRAAPRLGPLQAALQSELAALAADGAALAAVRKLAAAHADGTARDGSSTAERAVRVLPVAGLGLSRLAGGLLRHAPPGNGGGVEGVGGPGTCCAGGAGGGGPHRPGGACRGACLLAAGLGGAPPGPFLAALAAELHRLRGVVGAAYADLEERVAALGAALPPAGGPDGADAAARPPRASASGGPGQQRPPAERTPPPPAELAAPPYGAALDLAALQAAAGGASDDLVTLDDFIASSGAQLARLALQFDATLTAAAAAAAAAVPDSDAPGAAGVNGGRARPGPADAGGVAGAKRAGGLSLRGLRAGRRDQDGPPAAAPRQAGGDLPAGPCEATLLLMTPGVCSHSSTHRQTRYTAGVPPDVYHTSAHAFLSAGHSAEPALWGLSVVYARLRRAAQAAAEAAGGAAGGGAAEWTAPDQARPAAAAPRTRSAAHTAKYWVAPRQVLRLKLALLRHLPLLVYGAADPAARGDAGSAAALRAGCAGVTSLVSSVYFDSPALDVYHTRLARDDGARLVRLRFYGPARRREGAALAPERASLAASQVPAFLSGALPGGELSKAKEALLREAAAFLVEWRQARAPQGCAAGPRRAAPGRGAWAHTPAAAPAARPRAAPLIEWRQAPALRTEYLRTAWQRYDSNSVRLSLDEHMLLLRERGAAAAAGAGARPGDWCAPLEAAAELPAGDAVRFPYGVLEVKLQEDAPPWVAELLDSGVLVPVPRFSKFLHGAALLFPERVAALPAWFVADDGAGGAAPGTLAAMRAAAEERAVLRDLQGAALPAPPGLAPPGPPVASASAGPLLAPLRVPRLRLSGDGAALAGGAARGPPCAAAAPPAARDDWAQLSSARALARQADAGGVLAGAGLHTPPRGVRLAAQAGDQGDGGDARSWGAGRGGSGPFNAGVNGLPGWRSAASASSSVDGGGGAHAPERRPGAGSASQRPGGIRRLVGLVLPGGLGGGAGPGEPLGGSPTADGGARDAAPAEAHPLDLLWGRRGAASLDCCSFSSQDTVTTGSERGMGASAGAGPPHRRSHSGSSAGSGALRRGAGSLTARGGAGAAALGAPANGAAGVAAGIDSHSWQLSAGAQAGAADPAAGEPLAPAWRALAPHRGDAAGAAATAKDAGHVRDEGAAALFALLAAGAASGGAAFAPAHTAISVHHGQAGPPLGATPSAELGLQLQGLLPLVALGASGAKDADAAELAAAGAEAQAGAADAAAAAGAAPRRPGLLLQRVRAAAARGVRRWRERGGEPLLPLNEHLLGFVTGGAARPRGLVRTRIEPKTFFANERTFLAWLQIAVLVMMTGLGLLSGSSLALAGAAGGAAAARCADSLLCSAARTSGAIITAVAVLLMAYALHVFRWRTAAILARSTRRYDEQRGPALLTLLLAAVTLVSLALALQSLAARGGPA
ncbi:yippee-like protein [Scenedesmus sp. PABB004]|nr:yippee-like protein [Scenedesmus sp. PABB004]